MFNFWEESKEFPPFKSQNTLTITIHRNLSGFSLLPALSCLVAIDQTTLSTCSLIFSSSSFMSTTSFCMSELLALEPMVLISRPIS